MHGSPRRSGLRSFYRIPEEPPPMNTHTRPTIRLREIQRGRDAARRLLRNNDIHLTVRNHEFASSAFERSAFDVGYLDEIRTALPDLFLRSRFADGILSLPLAETEEHIRGRLREFRDYLLRLGWSHESSADPDLLFNKLFPETCK